MTHIEIDLKSIKENFLKVKERTKRKILVTVKSNAYGHGLYKVSKILEKEGVDFLGIARWEEGAELRERGIKTPILILGPFLPDDTKRIIKYRITPSITSEDLIPYLEKELGKRGIFNFPVHINIDTGMGRVGIKKEKAESIVKTILNSKYIYLEGIYTHFPSADEDEEFTRYQIKTFKELINNLDKKGISIPIKHTANSAGVLNFPESYFDMVRPGIMIYGYYPSPNVKKSIKIKPSLTWKAKVIHIKEVEKGTSISYGRTYFTKKRCKILTIGVGYGDGYSRFLSNKGEVILSGKKEPIVGRICMDQTMVEVSPKTSVKIGDEVILIGKEGNEEIKVEEMAEKIGTIPNEVVCAIGKRVRRVYKNG